ncbi:MAG: hypothetical protein V3V31_14195 [Methylococcales bacterium]
MKELSSCITHLKLTSKQTVCGGKHQLDRHVAGGNHCNCEAVRVRWESIVSTGNRL